MVKAQVKFYCIHLIGIEETILFASVVVHLSAHVWLAMLGAM